MVGSVSGEVEVNVPANLVWELYRSLELLTVTKKGLDKIVDKIEVVEGDGSVGTLLQFSFHPGIYNFYDISISRSILFFNVKLSVLLNC